VRIYNKQNLFFKTVGAGILSSAFSSGIAFGEECPAPNLLVIFPDQLNRNVLSCYGGPVPTPNIDRLAAEGVKFTQATCPTPYCSPSRMSLETSLYPHQHGIVQNCGWKQNGMTLNDETYAKILNHSGYSTHHYGKWHLEPVRMGDTMPYYSDQYRQFPEYRDEVLELFKTHRGTDPLGYQDWYGIILPVELSDPMKIAIKYNDLEKKWADRTFAQFAMKQGRFRLGEEDVFDKRVGDRAVNMIKKCSGQQQPFMITAGFNVPHDPYALHSPYYEMFDPDKIELPANHKVLEESFKRDWGRQVVTQMRGPNGEETGLREFMRIYYGAVKFLDDQVGRILTALEETGQIDNTIIIFLADHGDMVGGHGMAWKETRSFYEEVVVIPLIIRYPRLIKPRVNDVPAETLDLMPTILEMLNRPVPAQAEGKSLVPYMTGTKTASDAYPYTFSERVDGHPSGLREVLPDTKGSFMIRGRGFKYMIYPDGTDYLFDLKKDPGEVADLADKSKYLPVKKEMFAELNAWLERTGWSGAPAGGGKTF